MNPSARFALGVGAGALLVLGLVHRQLMKLLAKRERPPEPLTTAPSVTVIRPIRGLDVGAEENVRALMALDYPGELELLFVLDSETDPAFSAVSSLVRALPTRAVRAEVLIAGTPPKGHTGKLNAMSVGVQAARGELIAFNDSDTRPTRAMLSRLVAALMADPAAGSAFTSIYAASDTPLAGDVGYELLVNAWYGPSVVRATGAQGAIPFIMGQLMVFRRDALDSIGGVGCAHGQFVDDMYLGKQLVAAGWRNLVVQDPLRVVTGGMDLTLFFKTFRRWLMFSQSGLSFEFTWPNWVRGVACWAAWMALASGMVTAEPSVVLVSMLAIAYSVYDQVTLQRACHGPPLALRHLWVPALLPLFAGAVAIASRFSHTVDWRGRSYELDAGATLGA